MSYDKEPNKKHYLSEEFEYHMDEASYHLEQYLRSLEDMEIHYKKFREHAQYRDEFSRKMKEDNRHVS